MDSLIEKAREFLAKHFDINEIELSDGVNRVRLIRNSPSIMYYQPQDTCQWHHPRYHRGSA